MNEEQSYIPGTQVIRNKIGRDAENPRGTTNAAWLAEAEVFLASSRMAEILDEAPGSPTAPSDGAFTFGHMREIHKYLFSDVYEWAGSPRRVEMWKKGVAYASPKEAITLLKNQYQSLADENYLRDIDDPQDFARRLAHYWGEINHGHAFREGNTRAQVVFFAQLTRSAGFSLDQARFDPADKHSIYSEFVAARFEHQVLRGVEGLAVSEASLRLMAVLRRVVTPIPPQQPALPSNEVGFEPRLEVENPRRTEVPRPAASSIRPELRDVRLHRDTPASSQDRAPEWDLTL